MRRSFLASVAGLTLLAVLSCPASAQEAEPEPDAPAEAAPPPRKPKPKPRPKPQAKPADAPADAKVSDEAKGLEAKTSDAKTPDAKTPEQAKPPVQGVPSPAPTGDAAGAPPPGATVPSPAQPPSQTLAAAPPVACQPGEAVRYEAPAKPGKGNAGPTQLDLWVTRSGTITIDNPLRPLTPDVTRVLQVVIGGKVATAYGPDLLSLRRGAGPAVLEGVIGGAIRWDASLIALPDALPILSDSGEVLAEFAFRACGTAPAARTLAAPKARRTAPSPEAAAPEGGAEPKERGRPTRQAAPRPESAPPRPAVPLPQGAIP